MTAVASSTAATGTTSTTRTTTRVVADRFFDDAGIDVGRRDPGSGDDRAGLVGYVAGQRAIEHLRIRRAGQG